MAANENAQPPMTWRYCGDQIKLWRGHAQVSRDQLAEEADYAAEYVKSMEQGRRKPTSHLLRVADQVCGAHGMLTAAEEYLKPEKFASYSADYMLHEADSIVLQFFQVCLVPGLLQTEAYARALISGHWPPLDAETIERRIRSRLDRQALLNDPTRSFSFVIREQVLHCSIGDNEMHKEQLLRMLEVGEQYNASVQILLDSDLITPALHGPFVLLETAQHENLAYTEIHMGGVIYAEPERVSVMRQRYNELLKRALSPRDSAQFMRKMVENL
ncbi:helix-turn-helix domain-containing protein [Streptomyces sp. NPDC059788]|uniref:helix-turn-helix domain-containing protein n=1 Tax=Streptomyces sp. NPDC059788 TaxID=3346948 RepID=UPI0036483FD8